MKTWQELVEGKIQTHVSNGVYYKVMIDSSRFGKVFRLWDVEGLSKKDLPNTDEGWDNIQKVHAQAEDLIVKHYASKGIKPKKRW